MDRRLKVELFEEIRREYEFGVGTIQGVAEKLGVHRRMVRQAMANAIPPERKRPERKRPRLEAVIPFINAILEADRKAPRKQRHTSHRIYQRIRDPVLDAPEGRRDEFVQPYFKAAKPDQVVCILKAREPARIMTAIGTKKENRWHLELKQRWVDQFNFYINDSEWGRMFVRICPYFPFSARVCLNQHHWIANRLSGRRPFPAIDQCLYQLFRSGRPAGNRRFIDGTRSCPAADANGSRN